MINPKISPHRTEFDVGFFFFSRKKRKPLFPSSYFHVVLSYQLDGFGDSTCKLLGAKL